MGFFVVVVSVFSLFHGLKFVFRKWWCLCGSVAAWKNGFLVARMLCSACLGQSVTAHWESWARGKETELFWVAVWGSGSLSCPDLMTGNLWRRSPGETGSNWSTQQGKKTRVFSLSANPHQEAFRFFFFFSLTLASCFWHPWERTDDGNHSPLTLS